MTERPIMRTLNLFDAGQANKALQDALDRDEPRIYRRLTPALASPISQLAGTDSGLD